MTSPMAQTDATAGREHRPSMNDSSARRWTQSVEHTAIPAGRSAQPAVRWLSDAVRTATIRSWSVVGASRLAKTSG